MKVRNTNIGTPMLSHYCPNCGEEVFNSNTEFDKIRDVFIKECPNCNAELEFPNTAELMQLLGV